MRCLALTLLLPVLLAPLSGCPEGSVADWLGAANVITVVAHNGTDWDVNPFIRTAEGTSDWQAFLTGVFGGDELATGELAPGDGVEFRFDCDKLGMIFSDNAEQYDALGVIGTASDAGVLQRGDDFECGDRVEFEFTGEGDAFGVVVSVNGRVVN